MSMLTNDVFDKKEDEYLLISGIQHFIYCRRQWALIHVEQQWGENFFTIDGEIKHDKVDNGEVFESKKGIKIIRSMPVVSHELKVQGVCDVVELIPDPNGYYFSRYDGKFKVFPIEYKRGKAKSDGSDILQLLAQVVCLEEMLGLTINEGACFYFETRRREQVVFTADMREWLRETVDEMNNYYSRKYTPKVKKTRKCVSCSLNGLCLPELDGKMTVAQYIERRLKE